MKILKNKTIAIVAIALAIAGCDSDTLPGKTGNSFGQLSLSGTPLVGETLTATVTDSNGVDESAISYSWMAGDVVIPGESSGTLLLTDAEVGSSITASVAYIDNDDYEERIKSSATETVKGIDTPATFSGLTANVANNVTEDLTGVVTIHDDDPGEDMAEVQNGTVTTFGIFSIVESGAWTYTLDTENPTISSLVDENDTVIDTIPIASVDGTPAELVITITGAPDAGGEPTKVAKITDNMTDDAGELRYKLSTSDVIQAGKLTVSFLKQSNIEKDAYIGLYGSSTSTSNALIDLRIQSTGYVIRNNEDIDIEIPFTADKWTTVEMTWDATAASDSVAPLLTLVIDGTSVTVEPFASVSQSLSDVAAGVQTVIFKLGDNSSVIGEPAFFVDNFKLFSDKEGVTTQFEDDFESYEEGVSLDTDNANSPYNSSTAETVVDSIPGPGGSTNPNNLSAQITDNMTDDAGELRYKLSTTDIIQAGKISVNFLKEDGIEKDAYIGLFGSSTSTSNALIDLRIQSTGFVIRNNEDIDIEIPFTADKWTNVEMTWDATAASDSVAPLLTLTIDGTSVTVEPFASVSQSLSDVAAGVQTVIFKLGDNGSTVGEPAYFIDDFKLFSDKEGITTQFEDDFESYEEGVSLDTDNADTPYNSSSAETVVAKKAK